MTESVQDGAQMVDGFPVDTSVKYELNAGKCEQCGHYKTWGFKIVNPKSGKQIPGHVTADGHKIGDGECPHWARIGAMNQQKSERRASAGNAAPPAAGQWIQDVAGSPGVASGRPSGILEPANQYTPQGASNDGHVIAFHVNGVEITTTIAQAVGVIEEISSNLKKAFGLGA